MSTDITANVDSDMCAICKDSYKYPIELNCKHKFCFLCIKFAKETSNECPLCRAQITTDLSAIEMNDTVAPNAITGEFPCSKWFFSSRDGRSWWYYDASDSSMIERGYQNWKSKKEGSSPAIDDNGDYKMDAINSNQFNIGIGSHAFSVQTDTSQFKITIGTRDYSIDFEEMEQTCDGNNGWRKICRREFANAEEKAVFDQNVRGIAGIYFQKH